ncbi:MAG: glycosyltransferase family 4 protein [Thermodesulfobium sp.]
MIQSQQGKVYLFAESFESKSQSGIASYSANIYESLKGSVSLEKVNYKIYNIPIFKTTLSRAFWLLRNNKVFKGTNLHVLSPEILPLKYAKSARKRVVSVHDIYQFEPVYLQYKKKTLKGRLYSGLFFPRLGKQFSGITNVYDHILPISNLTKKKFMKVFGGEESKFTVIPSIIDDKYKPLNTERKNGKTIIGYINSFSFNKIMNLNVFISAFKEIKRKDLELHIYGKNFPSLDLIKGDDRIKYFGFLPEDKVVETYNSFDFYLSTSVIEGFGLPIMKAKACKVPVLCYDGDLDMLVKGNTILWNENNVHNILENLGSENINQMVERAYQDAEQCRSEIVSQKLLKVYDEVFGINSSNL